MLKVLYTDLSSLIIHLHFFTTFQARGGGVLPYMGYMGTCREIGYGFLGSRSLNRVSFLTLLFLCPWCGP